MDKENKSFKEVISKAKELGSKGILVASGIVKAKSWEKSISELCKGLKSQ